MSKSIFDTIENGDTITAEVIAEDAWGAALDNGSDISGVDAKEHAKQEYEGYVEHSLIVCDDLRNGISDEEWSRLKEKAIEVIEQKKDYV